MSDHTAFRVIYYWRGERHEHSRRPTSRAEAIALVAEMRADKWQAHFEEWQVYSDVRR